MSKRRAFLIRILLIIVVIGCLTHTSWGQENDSVNISHPSSLPAKSEFSDEDILNHAQKSLDRSISILNTVATAMGVLVGLLTLIIVIGGALGFIGYRRWQEIREQAEKSAEETKKVANKAKKAYKGAKPIIEGFKKAEKNLVKLREIAMTFPLLPETLSEDQKRELDEYVWKSKVLEVFEFPLNSEDYRNRGVALYLRDKYDLALNAFDKAIELKPKFAAWYNKGIALDKLGRYGEALEAFDKAIELKPDFAFAWNNKGVELGKLDRHDEAIKAFDKAIELKPDHAEAWYNKACAYSLKGDKENALKNLSKAIDLDAKYKEMAKSDDAFKNLWDDEDFKRIVS